MRSLKENAGSYVLLPLKLLSAGASKEVTFVVVVAVADVTNCVLLKYSKSSQKVITVCVRAGWEENISLSCCNSCR